MKWKKIIIFFAIGALLISCPFVLNFGWRHRYSAIFILVGTWFLGESFSLLISGYKKDRIYSVIPRIVIGLGSLLMILSLILAWFVTDQEYYGVTKKFGYNTNGITIGLAGLVSLALAIFKKSCPGKAYSLFCSLWGVYILFYLFSVYGSLSTSVFIAEDLGARLGIGPYIALIGVLFMIVGGALPVRADDKN